MSQREQQKRLVLLTGEQPSTVLPLCHQLSGWQIEHLVNSETAADIVSRSPLCLVELDHFADHLDYLEALLARSKTALWVALVTPSLLEREAIRDLVGTAFHDYCTLPLSADCLRLNTVLGHAYGMAQLKLARQLEKAANPTYHMVGSSAAMLKVFKAIRKVAVTDAPVLITGDSGTGKEMMAQAIHQRSGRCNETFIAVNCGAIPGTLLESELFGYEKGAFTGASQQKVGRIEAANNGTLFLDEVGDLPLEQQVKLLRFLQEGCIERVGATRPVQVDVRVLAATHINLEAAVREGRFREDLYYRLNVLNVHAPSLAERDGDIDLLANYFFKKFAGEAGNNVRGFSGQARAALRNHTWPGNVRELINRVRRATVMCEGRLITPEDLGLHDAAAGGNIVNLEQAREAAERQVIEQSLTRSNNNVSQAARMLGVSRMTLYRLLDKHGLSL